MKPLFQPVFSSHISGKQDVCVPNVEKSEIFCLAAKGEIFGLCPQVKSNAYAFGEMKSTHGNPQRSQVRVGEPLNPPSRRISLPAGQFHRRRRFHPP